MMRVWICRVTLVATLSAAFAAACGGADGVVEGQPGCPYLYRGGLPVPPPPDGPSLCAPGVCNYQTQAGCGDDETCRPLLDNRAHTVAPACRPAGSVPAGDTCDNARLCAPGALCIKSPPDAATGTCRKLCCGRDWTGCDPGESCIRQLDVTTEHPDTKEQRTFYANVDLCYPVGTCNVLDPTACADEDRTCRIVDPTGAVACAPRSLLAEGDPCSLTEQCGPVLHCVDVVQGEGSRLACRKLCPWAVCAETGCDGDETCVHFDRNPPGVGECTPDWRGPPLTEDAGALPG